MRKLLLLDLDGTLYQSDAVYRLFARCVGEHLKAEDVERYTVEVETYLRGGGAGELEPASDWSAMVGLARPYLPEADQESCFAGAYARAREFLLSPGCTVRVSSRLRAFLEAARLHAQVVLVSNGPAAEARALLARLGIAQAFDAVHAEAGKPTGLLAAAEQFSGGPRELLARKVASVGDNWANDIAPALELGWAAGYVGPRATPRPATWQGRSLEDLIPGVMGWLRDGGGAEPA